MRAIARENPLLQGIIDRVDFNATTHGQRDLDDHRLSNLIEAISTKRLGLEDVEADIIGKSYEYLIRKFAEGSGQSAGEFYTPPEVGTIMSRVLAPEPGMTVYDPTCGSGGLLVKLETAMEEKERGFSNPQKERGLSSPRKGKIFLVNASQVFEKGDPKNFIPDAGIERLADTLIGWKEEEKLSRIVDHAELKKNDYNISPSRYIHTSDAETYRPVGEIVDELKVIEAEARETDRALERILKQLGI